jgi:hypothetical protein
VIFGGSGAVQPSHDPTCTGSNAILDQLGHPGDFIGGIALDRGDRNGASPDS